jgi:myo-inositol-1(or 4)-monophosphatase
VASLPDVPLAVELHRILKLAGEAALARSDGRVRVKSDGSRVSDADLAAQDVLVAGLREAFPADGIVSEEGVSERRDARAVWHVDPIDGTHAFLEGFAHWGPTVCRVVDGKLEAGAFWQPRLNELWFAARGAGAWRDGERLRPADVSVDPDTVLLVPSRAHRAPPFAWRGRTRGLGCTAAHLALVAAGGVGAAIVPTWQLWDVGCGVLLVEEAGRTVRHLSGAAFDPMGDVDAPFFAAAPGVVGQLVSAIHALGYPLGT